MTTIATYTMLPDTRANIDSLQKQGEQALAILQTGSIDSPADEEFVSSVMNRAHEEIKRLDALRLEVGKPAREAQKDINDYFRGAIEAWKAAKDTAKKLLSEAEQARAAANKATLEAVAATQNPEALEALVPDAPPPGAFYRNEQVISVVDFDAIPRSFLIPDLGKIRESWSRGESVPGTRCEIMRKVVVGR